MAIMSTSCAIPSSRPCLSARGNDSSRFPTVTEQAHWIRTIWPPQSCSSDAPRTSPSFAISPRPGECPASLSSTVSTPSLRPIASSSPPAWLSARPLTLPARFNHSSSKYHRITTALSWRSALARHQPPAPDHHETSPTAQERRSTRGSSRSPRGIDAARSAAGHGLT